MNFGRKGNRLEVLASASVPDHVIGLAWSPTGDRLAVGTVAGPVVLLDTKGNTTLTLPGHTMGTMAIAWQPNGSLLATAGQDGQARLWDTQTGAELRKVAGGAAWVSGVAWHPDGQRFATVAGKKARLWNLAGEMLWEFTDHPSTISDLAWQPGGQMLAVASYGGVQLYGAELTTPGMNFEWKGSPLALAWSPSGKILVHGNQDATVHFWYVAENRPLQMSGFPTKVRELSWDYSGRYLATGGGPGVCLWDTSGTGPEGRKPQILIEEPLQSVVTGIAWQRRNPLIASTYEDGTVALWQPAAKVSFVGAGKTKAAASGLSWSPDDKKLAVGSATGEVILFKLV
ncbi:MAG: WD40 repeat domain-containing protein [Fimbriiglobus sp.]